MTLPKTKLALLRDDVSGAAERWCLRLSTPRRATSDAAAGVITPPLLERFRQALSRLPVSSSCWKTCQHCYSGVAHPLLMYACSPPLPPHSFEFEMYEELSAKATWSIADRMRAPLDCDSSMSTLNIFCSKLPLHFITVFLFSLWEAVCRFHCNDPHIFKSSIGGGHISTTFLASLCPWKRRLVDLLNRWS